MSCVWRGEDGAAPPPPARRAAGVAAQLPSPGVKGRGDGAALESCVLVFLGGGTGKEWEAVGTGRIPDTRIRMPAAPCRVETSGNFRWEIKIGRAQAGGSRAGRRWQQARLGGGGGTPGQAYPRYVRTALTLQAPGCPGTWRVRGRIWSASVFSRSSLKSKAGLSGSARMKRRCLRCFGLERDKGGLRLGPVLGLGLANGVRGPHVEEKDMPHPAVTALPGLLRSAARELPGRTVVPSQQLLSCGFPFPPVGRGLGPCLRRPAGPQRPEPRPGPGSVRGKARCSPFPCPVPSLPCSGLATSCPWKGKWESLCRLRKSLILQERSTDVPCKRTPCTFSCRLASPPALWLERKGEKK